MRRLGPAVVAGCLGLMLLSGCRGDPVRDASQDVEFTSCSQIECSGTLPSGAEFEIILPEDWSGSLALFSHGLRGPGAPASEAVTTGGTSPPTPTSSAPPAQSSTPKSSGRAKGHGGPKKAASARMDDSDPPDSPKPTPTLPEPRPGGPEPAPLWGAGDKAIADVMLQAGYAVAGATPAQDGWSVGEQLVAADELYRYFSENVGTPNRVYAWGESTGGLTSVRLAELYPDWVSGAVAMCAPMSGPNPTYDLALDAAFAVKYLLDPGLRLVNYSSLDQAQQMRDKAVALVRAAAAGNAESQAKVLFIGSLVSLPTQTRTEPGRTLSGQVAAMADGIANLLDQSTLQRFQLEELVGGNPSGNFGSDYRLRVSADERVAINNLSPGATSDFYAQLAKGERIHPDERAEDAAAAQGELTGDLRVPVMTLHNAADPIYIAKNESWYRERVNTYGPEIAANLVAAFVLPPQVYSAEQPAEEGAGSCNFDPRTIIGVLIQLNDWVRNGQYPGRDSVEKAFRGAQVSLDHDPGPWPPMALSPLDPPIAAEPTAPPPAEESSPAAGGSGSAIPSPTGEPSATPSDQATTATSSPAPVASSPQPGTS